jgi:hypothetical protein
MQAIMKPQIVKLASSAATSMAVQQQSNVRTTTQPKTRRSFLDCLMAALAGWQA